MEKIPLSEDVLKAIRDSVKKLAGNVQVHPEHNPDVVAPQTPVTDQNGPAKGPKAPPKP